MKTIASGISERRSLTIMHTITFTCEVATPMFLSGTDGSTPELRPPSIKGALRFWWRAMNGDMGVAALKQEESRIFGGGGENGTRSLVTITIEKRSLLTCHSGAMEIAQYSGIGYLLYSTIFMQKRDCFVPGSEFSISFSSYYPELLETTVKAFACLVFFGGLGSRSRRGAGSVYVKNIEGNAKGHLHTVLKVFDTTGIDTCEELKKHIDKHLKPFIGSSSAVGSYSSLNRASLYVMDRQNDWMLALETIGATFKKVRKSIQSDVDGTPNFGMPIRHKRDRINNYPELFLIAGRVSQNRAKKLYDRRASPLVIKVIKIKDRCYFPIVLHLQGELLPAAVEIIDKNAALLNSAGERAVAPDSVYIQNNFLSALYASPIIL